MLKTLEEEFGFKIKTIQTDNGREFCNDRGQKEFLKIRKAALAAARKGRSRDAALAKVDRQADSGQEALMTAAIAAARAGASLGEIFAAARGQEAAPQVSRLRVHRGVEPFERIRMATEAWAEKHGGAPKI